MNLSEKARELQRAYHKKWRERNKDRQREYTRRYWEKAAQQTREA
jgi:hypothetical protein